MPPRARPARPNLGGLLIETKQPRFETMRPENLAAALATDGAALPIILDVRGSDFDGGHIVGAQREAFDAFDDRRADELLRELGFGPSSGSAGDAGAASAPAARPTAVAVAAAGNSPCVLFYCMYSQQRAPSCATKLLHRAAALGIEVAAADSAENIFALGDGGGAAVLPQTAPAAAAGAMVAKGMLAGGAAAPVKKRTLRICVLAGGFNLWVNMQHTHARRDTFIADYDAACWIASRDINTTVGGVPGGICLIHVLEVPIAQLAEENIAEDTGPTDEAAVAPAKTS